MGLEKESVKNGGGYVGGFFQLFDWTAKSRKKLFSGKSDLLENSNRTTKGNGIMAMTLDHMVDQDESGAMLCSIKSSEYSCSSSVTDDEGCGIKAPGVVARLMGLDSLPSSNLCEPYDTPVFGKQAFSLSDAQYSNQNIDYQHDHQIMYSGNLLNKVDDPARNIVQSKPQKMASKPIEKFQTEVLPPKSAKSIPVTHHKLLSPIKSPGFIPSKDAAHIMEAAAKILESGPGATTKAKLPLFGSSATTPLRVQAPEEKAVTLKKLPLVGSSVPLKVKHLKEKVDIAQKSNRLSEISKRPSESNAARILKGQSMNKSWNGSPDTSLGVSSDNEYKSRSKGKSVSLAIQAKVNVQRRECTTSTSGTGSLPGQSQQLEIKSGQLFKSQPNVKSNLRAKSAAVSGVLRSNNQKQNSLVNREKLLSKPSVSNFQVKKQPVPKDSSFVHLKNSGKVTGKSKTGVRKSGIEATYGEKDDLYCRSKNFPRKKRSVDNDFVFDNSHIMDSVDCETKPMPCNLNTNVHRSSGFGESGKNKGTDVISFTFTTPLSRQALGSEISAKGGRENYSIGLDHRGKRMFHHSSSMKLTSVGYNVIGDDTCSSLLNKKLQELTGRVDSFDLDSLRALSASSSASILQHLLPDLDAINTAPMLDDKRNEYAFVSDKFVGQYDSDFSSTDSPIFRYKHKVQRTAEVDESSSNSIDSGKLLNCRHPSPVSILESSFSFESCNSSMSVDCNSTEGNKLCSSVQAQEVDLNSSKFHFVKTDTELLDSASSLSTGVVVRKHPSTLTVTDNVGASECELEYIKEILCDIDSMFNNFASGETLQIINPRQFNQLESQRGRVQSDGGEPRHTRKVLFDCVSECAELKWRQLAIGGYKRWERGVEIMKRKEGLAKEVYREILGWRGLGNCMVDELVDKDMSSHGRWLDFGADAFLVGAEAVDQIVSSLLDEVISDLFPSIKKH